MNRPDVQVHGSTFGGGWIFALTDKGRDAIGNKFFGEPAAPLAPFGGEEGWIIEPHDVNDLVAFVREEGLKVSR